MAMHDTFVQHTFSKTELRALARKYWLLVLTVFLVGTIAMWGSLSVFFTELYVTNTKLLVKVGRENVETPGTVRNGQVISQGVRVADINSEVQMLSSQAMIETVVDEFGPDKFKSLLVAPDSAWQYPKYLLKLAARQAKALYTETLIIANLKKRLTPRQEAILAVTYGVKVEPIRDSDILVLQVWMPTPQLAVDVSNALLEAYMVRRVQVRQPQAGSAFFEARLENAHERLVAVEAQRAEVRDKWQIASADEQRSASLKQLASLEAELVQNEAERAGLVRQRDLMVERAATMAPLNPKEQVEARNPSIAALEDRLAQLRVEAAKLGTRYQENSETVAKNKTEIASLETAIEMAMERLHD